MFAWVQVAGKCKCLTFKLKKKRKKKKKDSNDFREVVHFSADLPTDRQICFSTTTEHQTASFACSIKNEIKLKNKK